LRPPFRAFAFSDPRDGDPPGALGTPFSPGSSIPIISPGI